MIIAWVNGKYIERKISVVRVKRAPANAKRVIQSKGK